MSLNSIVTLHHKLGLTDGSVLEDTFDGEPLTYHLGSGELAEGLELSLIDLEEGDEQTLDIGPDLAFGFPVDDMIHSLPRNEFNPDLELQPGLIIEFSTPTGETVPGTILEFDDASVKVDFNHPLAGQTIRYSVKIVAIEDSDEIPPLLN
ncbi:MAG: peptidylprolyl isomerase [Gammaproteobacteria bacterium]|nr:peptidylprolyl isomerase [Gammaproteobacteria bacterium]